MSDKKRIIWIDSIRGVLIILVVLGHAIQSSLRDACFQNHLWNLIYSFHMPAFMAISGWFAFSTTTKNINVGLCKRRFDQLMVPYLSWSLLRYVISMDYSIENLSRIVIDPDSYFWFLWVLFWIKVIFILNQKIAERYHMDEIFTNRHHLYSIIRHHGRNQPQSFRFSIPCLLLSVLLSGLCNA